MRSEDLSYFEGEEFKQALELYEASLCLGENPYMEADSLTDIAKYYMVHDQEDKAEECIRFALAIHPTAVDPQIFLARQHLFHGQLQEALDIADAIEDQQDREVLFLRQEIAIKRGQTEMADIFMRHHAEVMEEDRDHFMYDTAQVFGDYNEWHFMLEWAEMLEEENPSYDRLNTLKAEALVGLCNYKKALPLIEDAIDKDSFNTTAWYLMAEVQLANFNQKEALEAVDYLLAINEQHPEGMLLRASCLIIAERLREAHKQYQEYIRLRPNDAAAYYSDGNLLINLNRLEEALDTSEKALRIAAQSDMELTPYRILRCNILSRMGRVDEALEGLAETEKEDEDRQFDYEKLKAFVYLENERVMEADIILSNIIAQTNDYERILSIAIGWADYEYYDRSRQLLETLLKKNDDGLEGRIRPYLVYCYYHLNNKELYAENIQHAIEINPVLTKILFAPIFGDTPLQEYPLK